MALLCNLFATTLFNGMTLAQMNGHVQLIEFGAIVIIDLMLDRLRINRR